MSLQSRIDRWFIDTTKGDTYPPQTHHAKSGVEDHTTGNTVTPIIDGEAYMTAWAEAIEAVISHPKAAECAVYHTGWFLANGTIHTKGKRIYQYLDNARGAGAAVHVVLSDHASPGTGTYLRTNAESVHNHNRKQLYEYVDTDLDGVDSRFPTAGSVHSKSTVVTYPNQPAVALVGSIDLSPSRYDRKGHAPFSNQGDRVHEVGVRIEGPATKDLLDLYVTRWNDSSREDGFGRPALYGGAFKYFVGDPPPKISGAEAKPGPASGSHAVQVLSTFAADGGYSWEDGEFTVWAAYLNAIRNAETYIYIEDQYFFPFGSPPDFACEERATIKQAALFYELGEAIKRGVRVLVVWAHRSEEGYQKEYTHHRELGVYYLDDIGLDSSNTGSFYAAHPARKTTQSGQTTYRGIHIHSKLMLVDDVISFVGSANFNRRSMTHDTETQVAVLDGDGSFTKDLRLTLWNEWLDGASVSIDDPDAGAANMQSAMGTSTGLLVGWSRRTDHPEPDCGLFGGSSKMDTLIDPYGGPDKDEVAE